MLSLLERESQVCDDQVIDDEGKKQGKHEMLRRMLQLVRVRYHDMTSWFYALSIMIILSSNFYLAIYNERCQAIISVHHNFVWKNK